MRASCPRWPGPRCRPPWPRPTSPPPCRTRRCRPRWPRPTSRLNNPAVPGPGAMRRGRRALGEVVDGMRSCTRSRRLRPLALALLLSFLCVPPAAAQLKELETKDLRLVYVDVTEAYLAPHVARTFHNSLDFQRRIFGWTPTERVTVLLTDFSDSGNAGATSVPRNYVTVQ